MSNDVNEKLSIQLKQSKLSIVDRVTSVDLMINDVLHILKQQIEKQRLLSNKATFTDKEVKTLEGLTDALVKLSREERERVKSDEFKELLALLTTEELEKIKARQTK